MSFEAPGVLWLIPLLPVLLLGLGLGGWVAKREIAATFRLNAKRLQRHQWEKYILASVLVALLVVALALPRVAVSSTAAAQMTGEIALLVDVSTSMAARTTPDSPSRLERVKPILYQVIDRMDTLAEVKLSLHGYTSIARSLVPWVGEEEYPYLQESIKKVLDVQSTPGTGSSLGRPILNVADKFSEDQRVRLIVLIGDGEAFLGVSSGVTDVERGWVEEAVEKARKEGIKVIAVGVGEPAGTRIPLFDTRGNYTGEYSKLRGVDYVTSLQEEDLQEMATRTGGRYFSEQEQEDLIAYLEENLSPVTTAEAPEETTEYRTVAHWFVLGALPLWVALSRRHLMK